MDIQKWGRRTFKRSEQIKKICKNLFLAAAILHPLGAKGFKSETTLPISFHQGFRNSKKFGHWTLGNGKKRPLNGVRNTDTKKNPAQ